LLARDAGNWPCRFGFSHHLGPVCRDQETTAVRHDDDQMWPTIAVSSAENLENTILEGMMSADYPNQLRSIIDLGSMRRFPSTRSARRGWSASWSIGSATRASSA
jgi:hypothetical protein